MRKRRDEGDSVTVGQYQAVHTILLFQHAILHLFFIKFTWQHFESLSWFGAHCFRSVAFATCFARTFTKKSIKGTRKHGVFKISKSNCVTN